MRFFLIFLVFLTVNSFAQNEWKDVYTNNGVTVKVKEVDCNSDGAHLQKWFLIKVENQTSDLKLIEWDLNLYDQNNKCLTCSGSPENHISFKIAANETLEGTCSPGTQRELRVIERFLDIKTVSEIMEVKLVNIKASAL